MAARPKEESVSALVVQEETAAEVKAEESAAPSHVINVQVPEASKEARPASPSVMSPGPADPSHVLASPQVSPGRRGSSKQMPGSEPPSPQVSPGRRGSNNEMRHMASLHNGGVKSLRKSKEAKSSANQGPRYPIADIEPSSPRVVLAEKRKRAWHSRVRLAHALPSESWQIQRDLLLDPEGSFLPVEPSLQWYSGQLTLVCGRVLIPAHKQVLSLQAHHTAGVGSLDEGEQLWPLLLEATALFACAAYHVHRAAEVLGCEANQAGHGASTEAASQSSLPMPPFMPKSANAALADLHLYVAKLQTSAPPLVATLQQLLQGTAADPSEEVRRVLDALPSRGSKGSFGTHSFGAPVMEESSHGGRLKTLFMAVPCIEEGMEHLGTLLVLVERSQGAENRPRANTGQKSRRADIADDEDFIKDDDSDFGDAHEEVDLLEAAALAEAPKKSEKASARPASAHRRGSPSPDGTAMAASPSVKPEGNDSTPQKPPQEPSAPEAFQAELSEKRRTADTQEQPADKPPPAAPPKAKKKQKGG